MIIFKTHTHTQSTCTIHKQWIILKHIHGEYKIEYKCLLVCFQIKKSLNYSQIIFQVCLYINVFVPAPFCVIMLISTNLLSQLNFFFKLWETD